MAVASPQLMAILVKSAVWLPGLASVNVASTTVPVGLASVALKLVPVASTLRGASVTTMVVLLVLTVLPPSSLTLTVAV